MAESEIDTRRQHDFALALGALIERFGGRRDEALERACVEQIVAALAHATTDGESLSPLDVARIRAGKFAAMRVPPAVFREPAELSRLRAELSRMALAFVGEAGAQGSRFG